MLPILSANEKEAAVKRAIIRVKPEYFSWSAEAQEAFRIAMPEKDELRIHQVLLKALFHITAKTQEEMDKVFDVFIEEQYLLFHHQASKACR